MNKARWISCLLLGLLFLSVALDPAPAYGRRSVYKRSLYNDDYLIRQSEEAAQKPMNDAVGKAMRVKARTPGIADLQSRLGDLDKQRADVTEKIINMRQKEFALMQTIKAWERQKNNNDWRIKDLEAQLQRME